MNCANPNCDHTLTTGKKLFCSEQCKKSVQNKRYLQKLKGYRDRAINGFEAGESTADEINETMEKENNENDFRMQILQPASNMPSPSKDPVVSFFIHDYKEKLNSAIREIDKRDDKIERLNEIVREKEKEIDSLNRAIDKMEDDKEKGNGLGGLLEGFKDESGSINWMGVSQVVEGLGKGAAALMGRGVPVAVDGLEGVDPSAMPHVKAFADWYVKQNTSMKQQVWTIIEAISNKPNLIMPILNIVNNGNTIRSVAGQ